MSVDSLKSLTPAQFYAAANQSVSTPKQSYATSFGNGLEKTPSNDSLEVAADALEESNKEKKSSKGLLYALGAAVVATAIWLLSRGGKGGAKAADALTDVVTEAGKAGGKTGSTAADVAAGAGKAGGKASSAAAGEVAEEVATQAPKNKTKTNKPNKKSQKSKTETPAAEVKTPAKQESTVATEAEINVPKSKKGKKKEKVEVTNPTPDVLPTVATPAVAAEIVHDVGKSTGKAADAIVDVAADAGKTSAKGVSVADDATGGAFDFCHSSSYVDDVGEETIDIARRGTFGQDIYDSLDPRNADDILSPYYQQKGSLGQDLNDPFSPFNKQDPMSPFYDPFSLGY